MSSDNSKHETITQQWQCEFTTIEFVIIWFYWENHDWECEDTREILIEHVATCQKLSEDVMKTCSIKRKHRDNFYETTIYERDSKSDIHKIKSWFFKKECSCKRAARYSSCNDDVRLIETLFWMSLVRMTCETWRKKRSKTLLDLFVLSFLSD